LAKVEIRKEKEKIRKPVPHSRKLAHLYHWNLLRISSQIYGLRIPKYLEPHVVLLTAWNVKFF